VFTDAVRRHQAGQFDEAERLYGQVLTADPGHAASLHLLGVVAYQTGRYDLAADLISQAITITSEDAAFHSNLGLVLAETGRLDEAIASYRHAIDLAPDAPGAHYNLGLALRRLGRLDEAIACYRRALAIKPDYPQVCSDLGIALHDQSRPDEAIASYRRALDLAPDFPEALTNLGIALQDQGRLDEAVACHGKAIALRPDIPQAQYNLGKALQKQGRLDDAAIAYGRALDLWPDFPEALTNLGMVRQAQGRPDEAVACLRRALDLAPDLPEAMTNLGIVMQGQGRLDEAAIFYGRALELRPEFPEAHYDLGVLRQEQGRPDEAIASYRRALELKPNYPEALAHLVHQRHTLCDWEHLDGLDRRICDLVLTGQSGIPPFSLLALPATTPGDLLTCAAAYARQFQVAPLPPTGGDGGRTGDRIRIGYLSADFREHAVGCLLPELVECHDRRRFEIFGYSYGPVDDGPTRRRLAAGFDRFVDLRTLSHFDAARRIQADGIDILVDLQGYTTYARAEIVALRPAPIQASFLGNPGTTGAEFIDYIVANERCIPPGHEAFYSERVVRLPDCHQPSDTRSAPPAPTPSRATCGLPGNGFVFCCFNASAKITPAVFAAWMRLLAGIPGAVLWLAEANPWMVANLRREAAAKGIDPSRLVFMPHLARPDYLARLTVADLFLDTHPYGAGAVAADCLWAGLPLVALCGDTYVGRMAASVLDAAGLPELIATSPVEYEEMALRLAREPAALGQLRDRLRAARTGSPLFAPLRFARNLEAAFLRMWEIHRAGHPPEPITIAAGTPGGMGCSPGGANTGGGTWPSISPQSSCWSPG